MCTSENNAFFVLLMFCPCSAPSFYLTKYWRNCDKKCNNCHLGKWISKCLKSDGNFVSAQMGYLSISGCASYTSLMWVTTKHNAKMHILVTREPTHGAFIGSGSRQSGHSGIKIGNQVWYFCMRFYTDFSNGLIFPYVATSNVAI